MKLKENKEKISMQDFFGKLQWTNVFRIKRVNDFTFN